ncbi:hypothetical protein [Nostoc sp. DSM 114159]
MRFSKEKERIFGVKNVLVSSLTVAESNRETSDEIDEIELLDIVEELIENLSEVLGKHY